MDETVTVVTLQSHQYAGKVRVPGEEYQAFAKDLRLITALGWVREKPVSSAQVREQSAPSSGPKPKNRYKRRDLRPE